MSEGGDDVSLVEAIPWAALGGLTPAALLSLVVILILTGKLVPKSTYDVMRDQKRYWRDAAIKNSETIQIQARTISNQEVVSDTVAKFVHAAQEANQRGNDGGDKP